VRKHLCCSLAVLLLAGVMCANVARASIFYNAPPDQLGASDMNAFAEADDFVVPIALTLTGIRFWTAQGSAADYAGSTFTALLNDNAGVPGSTIASGTHVLTGVATGNTLFGLNEFQYQFNVNVVLNPGTYWLVLHNGPLNTIPATDFFWEWSSDSGNSESRDLSAPAQPWLSNDAELAFELQGTLLPTPEPASVLLIGAGLLGVWAMRRRKTN
jgi:hypothetical protein